MQIDITVLTVANDTGFDFGFKQGKYMRLLGFEPLSSQTKSRWSVYCIWWVCHHI